jgi:sugar/nucleoside kinase (ribokinase family)
MIPDAGASSLMDQVELERLTAADLFYLSGYVLLLESTRSVGREAIKRAMDLGIPVAVDVASAAPIIEAGAMSVRSWLHGVDCLLANEDEAHALTGLHDPWAAAQALARAPRTVVVKLGERGAIAIHDGQRHEVPAEQGVVVVDTVGAGDSFAAGFLPAWGRGEITEALRVGTRTAARCVSQLGARPRPHQITAS